VTGESDESSHALFLEFVQRFYRTARGPNRVYIFHRRYAVELQEIDVIRLKALQALLHVPQRPVTCALDGLGR
jgi:hypothetical protein